MTLEDEGRRYPSTVGGLVYLVVVAVTAVGLLVTVLGPWRRGIVIIGASLLLAAVMRLFLREADAGMLRVRRRWADVLMMVGVGVTMIVLANVIPNQPG